MNLSEFHQEIEDFDDARAWMKSGRSTDFFEDEEMLSPELIFLD